MVLPATATANPRSAVQSSTLVNTSTTTTRVPPLEHPPVRKAVSSLQKIALEVIPPAGIPEKQIHAKHEKRHFAPILFTKDDIQLLMEESEYEMKKLASTSAANTAKIHANLPPFGSQKKKMTRIVVEEDPDASHGSHVETAVPPPNMFQLAQDLLKRVRERRGL